MNYLPDDLQAEIVQACADLVARTGAAHFEVGYNDEDPDAVVWYAKAQYTQDPITKTKLSRGDLELVEYALDPTEACSLLASRVLDNAKCQWCHKIVITKPPTTNSQKRRHCLWSRVGNRWLRGCLSQYPDPT